MSELLKKFKELKCDVEQLDVILLQPEGKKKPNLNTLGYSSSDFSGYTDYTNRKQWKNSSIRFVTWDSNVIARTDAQ